MSIKYYCDRCEGQVKSNDHHRIDRFYLGSEKQQPYGSIMLCATCFEEHEKFLSGEEGD